MSSQPQAQAKVKISLLWKITLPFMLLALVIGLGATVIVNRLIGEEELSRFLRQLADSGQQATDAVVRSEQDLLEIERLVANTEGVAEALFASSAEDLRTLVLPIVVNAGLDTVTVIDTDGISLLAVRRGLDAPPGEYDTLRGEAYYADWAFIQRVLDEVADQDIGDKHTGVESIRLGAEQTSVFMVAGPVFDRRGSLVGAVVVGAYLKNMVDDLANQAAANIAVYDLLTGLPLSTTHEPEQLSDLALSEDEIAKALDADDGQSPVRLIDVSGTEYFEVLTPFVARQGSQEFGILGVSLLRIEFAAGDTDTPQLVIRIGAVALAAIVLIGLLISNSITRPLIALVNASSEIAKGNLDTSVVESGSDEIGVLARTFNQMVDGLKEGWIYRDLLGRTVTPEVREQLKHSLVTGGTLLSGQSTKATILYADFRGFTSMAEQSDPSEVMNTLNDYFAGVVPIISLHGGVVNKFDGDALMAFFGILPTYLPPHISALKATHAGVEMLELINRMNDERASKGAKPFEIGIGISTGSVIAGGLGSEERVHYTVVGDTVNVAQRIQQIAGEHGLVVSQDTYRYLGSAKDQFDFGRIGKARLRGKDQPVMVYEVQGRLSRLISVREVEDTIERFASKMIHKTVPPSEETE
jgi:class 3 adenylate cyclase